MAVSILGTPATFTSLTPADYTPEVGADLVLQAFTLESNDSAAPSAVAGTLEGVAETQVNHSTATGAGKTMTEWKAYLLDANIPVGASTPVITLTGGTGNQGYAGLLMSLAGVAQTGLTNVSASGTVVGTPLVLPPSGTLTYADGDLGLIVISHDRTPPTATATDWTFTNITGSGGDAGMSYGTRIFSGAGTVSASVALSGGGSACVGTMYIIPAAATTSAAITGTVTPSATEAEIRAGGDTVIITLTGDTWVASGATFDAQRQNIINGLDAAASPALGWNNVVQAGLSVTAVVRTSNTVVTVTLSAFPTYSIAATETITVTVPGSALTGGSPLTGAPTFTVTRGADDLVQPVGVTNASGVPTTSSGSLTSDLVGLTRLVATAGGVALDTVVVITKRTP